MNRHHEEPGLMVRIASYAAMIIACSVIVGVVFWGWPLIRYFDADTRTQRQRATRALLDDTQERMSNRFWIGAVVGGMIGAGAIVGYHIKHGVNHLK